MFEERRLTNRINLPCLHNLESTVPIILVVRRPRKRGANTRVDVSVVPQQALLRSVVEVGSVVDRRDLAGRAAKDLGLPCIPGRNSVSVVLLHSLTEDPTDGCQSE